VSIAIIAKEQVVLVSCFPTVFATKTERQTSSIVVGSARVSPNPGFIFCASLGCLKCKYTVQNWCPHEKSQTGNIARTPHAQ
jgi:hypothetical protein